jgi:hypothetical protein
MNNPFEFFDKIYCINLDHRKDRWEESVNEFKKLGIENLVERFPAIKHDDGRVGIIKSNLEIVKIAKEKSYKNVLVFEDDISFIHANNPLDNLKHAIEQSYKYDWKLFYLGANTHNKLIKIDKNLILLKNAFAVHSMAYNYKIYDKFINYAENINKINNPNNILDVWLAKEIQEKNICIMVNPILTTQRKSYSDIEKQVVDYQFIIDRFNKNIK